MPSGIELLENGLSSWEMDVTPIALQQFQTYYSFLDEWNKKVNITALKELDEVMIFHFLDSLTPLLTGKITEGVKMIDIGSGGGFPGIPIKIMKPDIKLTLVDSSRKRVTFLQELVQALELKDVEIFHERAEKLGNTKGFRESFDVVLSRAVAQLRVLCEYCLPFAQIGGVFIAHKGPGVHDELVAAEKAIKILGGKTENIFKPLMESSDRQHFLLIIEKIRNTPTKYPRLAGTPEKLPI